MIVFDLTNVNSYRHTVEWLSEFRQQAPSNAKIMLVGNKLDLVEINPALRCTEKKLIEQMAKVNNILYIETSAAVDKNVVEAFHVLLHGK